MKPYKIKVFWTHVLYVTIAISVICGTAAHVYKMASTAKHVFYCLRENKIATAAIISMF